MSERLATLFADERGVVGHYTFTTYTGGMITRDDCGALRINEILGNDADTRPVRERYQSACIRITGGFDD